MKLVAETPLRAAWRPWSFAPGDWRLVVAVKATFDLPREGVATLAEDQAFVSGDAFWDDDPERSIRYDDDLALLKPEGEWWLTGTLRAPEPVRELACCARVGERELRFDVIGDRWWQPDGSMSTPEAFSEMRLAWERSFGGPGFGLNPVGRGLAADPFDAQGRIALPNVERHGRLIRSPRERPEPVGLWPIPRSWPERTRLMGTYDGGYLRDRWPYFAADFSWRYFQAARELQRLSGYWRGDEEIELANLHPVHRRVRCRLPSIKPRAFVHERARPQGPLREVGLVLDTIAIDAGEGRAFAVWRGATPCPGEALEADFIHLYLTHDVLGQSRSEREHLGAFIAKLRTLWEEEHGSHPQRPPAATRGASEPAHVEAPEEGALSVEDEMTARRRDALEAGVPEPVVEALYPTIDPAAAPTRAQVRAQLEANVGVAEQLGAAELVEDLRELIAALDAEPQPASAPKVEPPRGLWTAQQLRDEVQRRLAAGEPLSRCKLIEADLSLMDLSGQDLSGSLLLRADLRGANLDRCRLEGAVLDGAKLEGATLREALLEGASLAFVEANQVDFTGARLVDARFERALLGGATFDRVDGHGLELEECYCVGASFERARLTEAELARSNFDEANLRAAVLTDARLEGSSLRRACLDHVQAEKLRASDGADLSEAGIRWSMLDGSSFARSICIGTKFTESDLGRASFASARLEGAEFMAAKARGTSFVGALMAGASLLGADLLGARFEGADLRHADFRNANAYGAEFWRADTTAARWDGANVEGTKLR